MRKMIVFGAICLSATVLLAQTQEKQVDKAPPPIKTLTGKFTPLNVKTGLWQNTATITISGSLGLPEDVVAKLTPEQKARYEAAIQAHAGEHSSTHTNKGCLTQEDLTKDPFEQKDSEGIHCHGTLLSSTSTDIVLQEACTGDASMTYTMKIHAVDQEHATGTGQGTGTMGGKTMNSSVKWDAKWLGATCPADANQE